MFMTLLKLIAIGAITAFVAGRISHEPFDMIVGNKWMFWFLVFCACVSMPTHFLKCLSVNGQTAFTYILFGFFPILFVFYVGFFAPMFLASVMESDTIDTAIIMLAESSGIVRVAFLSIVWMMMGISFFIAVRGIWLTRQSGKNGSPI